MVDQTVEGILEIVQVCHRVLIWVGAAWGRDCIAGRLQSLHKVRVNLLHHQADLCRAHCHHLADALVGQPIFINGGQVGVGDIASEPVNFQSNAIISIAQGSGHLHCGIDAVVGIVEGRCNVWRRPNIASQSNEFKEGEPSLQGRAHVLPRSTAIDDLLPSIEASLDEICL